jgi:hypothetical protein
MNKNKLFLVLLPTYSYRYIAAAYSTLGKALKINIR